MNTSNGKKQRDIEIASETILPVFSKSSRGKKSSKTPLSEISQLLEHESFDPATDKKNKGL